jgi:CYTH domain-containing protein
VHAEWLEGSAQPFIAEVRAFVDALSARAAPAARAMEIERKYLLSSVPDAAREAPCVEIEQGYVPGERLVERVRRVRADGTERCYRTVKLGAGVARIEIEEETTSRIFDALWALTEGRRVRKERYAVADGDLVWEIDRFLDRDLVLAEVELSSAAHVPELPEWLREHVVRDVTGEAEYTNLSLAH